MMSSLSGYALGAAMILMGTGVVLVTASSVILTYRAFRESLTWGVACAVLPLATFLFVIRFWQDTKGVFRAQLFGVGCAVAGFALLLTDPGLRAVVRQRIDPALLSGGTEEETSAATTARHEAAKQEERRRRAEELYLLLQAWHAELAKKQPVANADAARAEAFRKEYANYQSLLAEYKAAAREFRSPLPSPSPGGKKGGK